MSRRKPARAGITNLLGKLQQQWNNLSNQGKTWLDQELRSVRSRPVWLKVLLVTWRVIKLLLTESQRSVKKYWKQRGQLWLYTQRRFSRSGFLLPMISVLLVVFSLVVAAIMTQSVNRTTEVGAKRNEQIVYNTSTLAIDRAKAKLEYMFNRDPRWPRGLPGDDVIEYILLNGDPNVNNNDPQKIKPHDLFPETSAIDDPYTFGDEERIDIDGDGKPDNAWTFLLENDDGTERVAYTLLTRVSEGNVKITSSDKAKAPKLVVRNGPINMTQPSDANCIESINDDEGWEVITGATVRRAFQTFVVVVKDEGTQRNVSTLEMQQDREADKGNKWGAWFRNDLEVFPGPDFRWNGAIHTEGNLMIGGDSTTFQSYLISSSNSCLYARQNSEITIGGNLDETTPPFLGQLVRGSMKTNNYGGSFVMHIHDAKEPTTTNKKIVTVETNHIDSVKSGSPNPVSLSLDPVVLWTTNDNVTRGSDPTNATVRDTNWKNSPLVQEGRVFNRSSQPPYVDDTYRADNRYGPKPRYTQLIGLKDLNKKIGTRILDSDPFANILLYENEGQPDSSGLDGYWERRARGEGLTIIVGQRLELGNTNGWQGTNDPLYPPTGGYCVGSRCHEQRQWKAMRDNLAAVQSTVVYHNDRNLSSNNPIPGRFPIACLASTVHPGTRTSNTTIDIDSGTLINTTNPWILQAGTASNAKTFARTAGTNKVITNFFEGNGTNGWEFNAPGNQTSNTSFKDLIDSNTPLRTALFNLAYFAGDPYGAFPARQDVNGGSAVEPTAGAVVHPYPTMSMWGDYSELRRAMDLGDKFTGMSIADQTTIQTAACTLGMLAYNMDLITSYDYTNTTNKADIVQVAVALAEPDTIAGSIANILKQQLDNTALDFDLDDVKPEDYIAAFLASGTTYKAKRYQYDANGNLVLDSYGNPIPVSGSTNAKTNLQLAPVIRALYWKEQLTRDRRFGFYDYISGTYNPSAPTLTAWSTTQRPVRFDPADNGYFGLPTTTNADKRDIQALAKGVTPSGVKFPALFYIFPRYNHNHNASSSSDPVNITQPTTEPYIQDSSNYVSKVNQGFTYTAVNPTDIILNPRERTNWQIPNTTTTSGRANVIRDNTTNVAVSFLDKGMFNGREMMSVRTMDLDLDLLRRNSYGNERWLPYSGIVYAFREDAVREDEIARPARSGASFSVCDTAAEIESTTCRMDAVGTTPYDPPLNDSNWVSSKPVDFYADPDRRPYGFRVRNGADLRREPAPPTDFNLTGMSLVSDNPVYVFGDTAGSNYLFNGHNTTGGSRIEEFTQLLTDDWSNFYSRSTLNDNFARDGDTWRPAEIISDAITIVSRNFKDGSIAEGITRANVGSTSSYRTLNAPTNATRAWLRENGSYSSAANNTMAIKISRNGYPMYCVNPSSPSTPPADDADFDACIRNKYQVREYGRETTSNGSNGQYMAFSDNKTTIGAQGNTRVNFSVVSGMVPSRGGQSYGGLHNFPRFIENWSNQNLYISGALIQLNFSTYATAPFDQDSWEPGAAPNAGSELINYYGAPTRRWGYDVGLQYAPAGPVASRFIAPSNTRSEFYREPAIDDPYMCLLRKAKVPGGSTTIDPDPEGC